MASPQIAENTNISDIDILYMENLALKKEIALLNFRLSEQIFNQELEKTFNRYGFNKDQWNIDTSMKRFVRKGVE